ncbi:hypothetical protein [Streptomyces sp. NPDC029674]|uniref:hypothetical protein n=1 Tax=Streptomyces sp. NPDC029674 TaxID=3365297 RepID=UPI00384BFBA9
MSRRCCPADFEIDAVRRALQRHDVITGRCDDSSAEPVPVAGVQRDLWLARTGFQAGHFAQLGVQIPKLLMDATRAAERHEGDDQLRAHLSTPVDLAGAQSYSAALGREQFSTVLLGRVTTRTWSQAAPQVATVPKTSTHPGRFHIVQGSTAHPTQVLLLSETEAAAWAAPQTEER